MLFIICFYDIIYLEDNFFYLFLWELMLRNELYRRLEEVAIGSKIWDYILGVNKFL